MYSNIGKKIKGLAVFVALVGIIASIVGGGRTIAIGYDGGYFWSTNDDFMIFIGVLIIVIGSLISWVSGFVLYGFGQLVENSDTVARYFSRSAPSPGQAPKRNFDPQTGAPINAPAEPKVPVADRIQNAVDKGFIAAKGLYDKSGQLIGERAQKAQTRQTGAEGYRPNPSGGAGASRPSSGTRPAVSQRPLDGTGVPDRTPRTDRHSGADIYSDTSLETPSTAQPRTKPATQSNSFASSYEFSDQ